MIGAKDEVFTPDSSSIDRVTGMKKLDGFAHFTHAFKWSMAGFKAAFSGEAAFRQEVVFFIVLAPIGVVLGDNGLERALLVGCLLLVLVTELLNTAIESVVDRVGLDYHDLSKRAKDLGSAAVFVALVTVGVVWSLVLLG
jgi:diacylglycerol kinase (EC 2.7.1.107)